MTPLANMQTDFDVIHERIQQQLVADGEPGMSVAVAQNGHVLWLQGFGWADREQRIPATEHTMYALASVTKPITATALMVLAEQGHINIDRPINDYLGELGLQARIGNIEEATVRRVANHTAGLPMHYQFFYVDETGKCPLLEETIKQYGQLVTQPGERFAYSNLGYAILGYLIERVSGLSYAEFLRRQVFLPLGMEHTSVNVGPGLAAFQATRYGADRVWLPWYEADTPGASAVFGSIYDLVRFGMFHLKAHLPDQTAILSDATLDEMKIAGASFAPGRGYGLGWWTNADIFGYRTVSHAGSMDGASASLWLIPSEQLVVAAAANSESELPFEIIDDIFAHLLPAYADQLARQRAAQPADDTGPTQATPMFVVPSELVGHWSGKILTTTGELPFQMWFQVDGDVYAQVGEQIKTVVNNVHFANNRLGGRILGILVAPNPRRSSYHLRLDLTLREAVLNGAVVAVTGQDGKAGSALERRSGDALSYWAEIRKQS
jgi:CubicO group peptidase (beta-lactamase class C family)